MEAVGAAGDQPDLVVERLGAALVDAEADRVEDPVAVLADRLAQPDERLKPTAGRSGEEPVDEDRDVLDCQAGGEDRSERFLEGVGAPHLAAGSPEAAERPLLIVVEVLGCFEQRPAGVLEPAGGVLVAEGAQLVSVRPANVVERPVRQGDDVERVNRDD